jgi:hypothetical protein
MRTCRRHNVKNIASFGDCSECLREIASRPNTSPIEMMIDKACGHVPKEQRRTATDQEKNDARSVADDLIYHIDQMYPAMWNGASKSARTSVRNNVFNSVLSLLMRDAN